MTNQKIRINISISKAIELDYNIQVGDLIYDKGKDYI